jgi:Chaperone of endosialidase
MEGANQNVDAALQGIDEAKRATLRRLIVKGTFMAPIVASFAMSGLTVERAAAQSNSTSSRPPTVSDRRLKKDVTRIAVHPAGFGIYRFKYLWSDIEYSGVIAQEVLGVMPDAVARGDDGFLRVDYAAIGMQMDRYPA